MRCLQNDNVFYFGGPLLGINDPTLRCNSEILTNSDGTRVSFSVAPRPSLGASVETAGEGPLTAADLDLDMGDGRNPFDDAEFGSQDTEDGLDGEVRGSVVSIFFIFLFSIHFHNNFSTPLSTPTQQQLNTTLPHPPTHQLFNIAFHITHTSTIQYCIPPLHIGIFNRQHQHGQR